jgi:hypothetical protein
MFNLGKQKKNSITVNIQSIKERSVEMSGESPRSENNKINKKKKKGTKKKIKKSAIHFEELSSIQKNHSHNEVHLDEETEGGVLS